MGRDRRRALSCDQIRSRHRRSTHRLSGCAPHPIREWACRQYTKSSPFILRDAVDSLMSISSTDLSWHAGSRRAVVRASWMQQQPPPVSPLQPRRSWNVCLVGCVLCINDAILSLLLNCRVLINHMMATAREGTSEAPRRLGDECGGTASHLARTAHCGEEGEFAQAGGDAELDATGAGA